MVLELARSILYSVQATTTLKPVDGFGPWSDLNQHSAGSELPPHQHLLLQKTSTIFHNGNAAPSTPCQSHAHPWPDLRLWWGSWAWPDRSDSQRLPAFSWLHRPGEVRTLPGKILPCCVLWYYLSWDTGSIGDLIFGGAKYLSFYFSQMSRAINQLPGRREQAGGSEHRKPGVRGDRRGVKEERVQQGNSSSSSSSCFACFYHKFELCATRRSMASAAPP